MRKSYLYSVFIFPVFVLFVGLPLSLNVQSVHADITIVDTRFRLTYDPVVFPSGEEMGLLGTTVLANLFQTGPLNLDAGAGVYSAVKGSRGGFFTGGLALNARLNFNRFTFETGYFLGGGGGDAAPQGGGLMLRPHISILYDFERFSAGITLNKIRFPNGGIDSDQVGIQIDMPFQLALTDQGAMNRENMHLRWKSFYLAPTLQWYDPRSGVKNTNGLPMTKTIQLVGVEFGKFVNEGVFVFVESAGAYGGGTDGYAELFGGGGVQFPFLDRFSFRLKAAAGSSGGGQVDTGGGVIGKVAAGFSFGLAPDLSIAFDYGWVDALEGTFSATAMKAILAYQFETAMPTKTSLFDVAADIQSGRVRQGRWALRTSVSRYLASAELRKFQRDEGPVDLFVFKFDRYLNPSVYLTGQAGAAFRGGAGGYATGHFGAGLEIESIEKIRMVGEFLVGAGGGGGIASGSGAILQPMLGLRYAVSKNQGVQVMLGHLHAPNGSLDETVIDVGWVYSLVTLERIQSSWDDRRD